MELKELIQTINPEKDYSLSGAIKLGVFKETLGLKSYPSCLNFIFKDKMDKNGGILKAKMSGEGRGTIYFMKGKNIINFLKMYEEKFAKKEDNQKNR